MTKVSSKEYWALWTLTRWVPPDPPSGPEFFCFPNMGCGYSKLVSLDTDNNKESIAIRRLPQFEKTVKKC